MKLIIAIIQPYKLDSVRRELNAVEVYRLSVSNIHGYGRQKGEVEYFRAQPYTSTLLPKTELKIAVNEEFVEPTINAIIKGARTDSGQIGDGKIFVLDLLECVRISDGTRGPEAI
ncbi:MAG: P-II family nitrogen regulator [Nitrospirae bacterium]|nr:MAG: P-II family nitrogen regulator [Nitrospirota bacterium]